MYDDIIGLKDPIICQRGVFFGVAPPIYTRVCIYPLGNDRSLGTFPVAALVPVIRGGPRRPRGDPREPR